MPKAFNSKGSEINESLDQNSRAITVKAKMLLAGSKKGR